MENKYLITKNGITYLDLSKNPEWKAILKSTDASNIIHQIYLDSNSIEDLEDVIDDLIKHKENLWFINLDNNKLKQLPEKFKELSNIRSLSFRVNQLSFPDQLLELTQLEYLNLALNPITNIPDEISKLQNLNAFIFTAKVLNDLGNGIFKLLNLKHLTIFNSNLKFNEHSNNFSKLKNLEVISGIEFLEQDLELLEVFKDFKNLKEITFVYEKGGIDSYALSREIENKIKMRLNQVTQREIQTYYFENR